MVDGGRERPSGIGGVTFGHPAAFWTGVALVIGGVVAHLPMYLMGKDMGYRLAGMPMEKPLKTDEIIQTIRRLIDRRRLQQHTGVSGQSSTSTPTTTSA